MIASTCPSGGALSGIFGGPSGLEGALRSAFPLKIGLGQEAYIMTGGTLVTNRYRRGRPILMHSRPHAHRAPNGGDRGGLRPIVAALRGY